MKILVTERQYKLIQEQWWMGFIEAAVSEGPGMGWGWDIDTTGGKVSGGNPEKLKEVNVELGKVQNLIDKANTKKNKINSRCSKYTNITIPRAHAGEIQDFLIKLGHRIGRDANFGDETATALGTYFYGVKKGINSVLKLWEKLGAEGLTVGSEPGFGGLMATAVSSKISGIVNSKKSGCKTDLATINKILKGLEDIQNNLYNIHSKYEPKGGNWL